MYECAVLGCGSINEFKANHLQFMKRTVGVKVTITLVLSMHKPVDLIIIIICI